MLFRVQFCKVDQPTLTLEFNKYEYAKSFINSLLDTIDSIEFYSLEEYDPENDSWGSVFSY